MSAATTKPKMPYTTAKGAAFLGATSGYEGSTGGADRLGVANVAGATGAAGIPGVVGATGVAGVVGATGATLCWIAGCVAFGCGAARGRVRKLTLKVCCAMKLASYSAVRALVGTG